MQSYEKRNRVTSKDSIATILPGTTSPENSAIIPFHQPETSVLYRNSNRMAPSSSTASNLKSNVIEEQNYEPAQPPYPSSTSFIPEIIVSSEEDANAPPPSVSIYVEESY